MIAAAWWDPVVNPVLDGLGAVLAFLYSLVPNYGVAIIILTLGFRLLLLPLGIKQIRSMHAMQAIQPRVKELQSKYKGNRQKITEEQMKLYKEYGVSPFGGCLPLVLQIPVLLALFAVLRFPSGVDRIPEDSRLHAAIEAQDTHFLGANLLCTASQAGGGEIELPPGQNSTTDDPLDCGTGFPVRIPYYLFLAAMIGTTFYQTWQMQRASPVKNPQQQLIGRIMPVFFGFIGFSFPAGLVLYWTTTNLVQIGQQHFMLPKKGEVAPAPARPAAGDGSRRPARAGEGSGGPSKDRGSGQVRASGGSRKTGSGERERRRKRGSLGRDGGGQTDQAKTNQAQGSGSGERRGGSRKKRRKR